MMMERVMIVSASEWKLYNDDATRLNRAVKILRTTTYTPHIMCHMEQPGLTNGWATFALPGKNVPLHHR
jgi:hypothetical protein